MFMHSPRLARRARALDDEKRIGPLRRVMSVFSFAGDEKVFHTTSGCRTHRAAGVSVIWAGIVRILFAMKWELREWFRAGFFPMPLMA